MSFPFEVQDLFFSHFIYHRQDALQRHWDKYCRKKSKRHLDRQATELQLKTTMPPMPTSLYAPAPPPPQLTSITTATSTNIGVGTGLDQVIISSFNKYLIKYLFLS